MNKDMERFTDPCDESRTKSQILWEEAEAPEGSFRLKWQRNFGRLNFYKFGKKICALLFIMFFWTGISIVADNDTVKMIMEAFTLALVNTASVWLYRQITELKRLTFINVMYIIGCFIFSIAFYDIMCAVFERFGHAMFLSVYYIAYIATRNTVTVVRISVTLWLLYKLIIYNVERKSLDVISGFLGFVAMFTGMLYRMIGEDNIVAYHMFVVMLMILAVAGFVVYIFNRNVFTRNMTLGFCLVSFMEVVGEFAFLTGSLEKYIMKGIW